MINLKKIALIADAVKGTCAVAGGFSLIHDHKVLMIITFSTAIACELVQRLYENFHKKRRTK